MTQALQFELLATDGQARTGRLTTRRGVIETPGFMPVGTAGTVKGMLPSETRALGASIVLANTYHLHVRPGEALVKELGGLHRFSGWPGPILTDSGGYQVFSLAARRTIDEDGVTFLDHVEGSRRRLTPEISIAIQEALGSEISQPGIGDDFHVDVRIVRQQLLEHRPENRVDGVFAGGDPYCPARLVAQFTQLGHGAVDAVELRADLAQ